MNWYNNNGSDHDDLDDLVPIQSDYVFTFSHESEPTPLLEFKPNGDVYIQGRLATNDMEIVEGMRTFILTSNANVCLSDSILIPENAMGFYIIDENGDPKCLSFEAAKCKT